MSVAMTKADGVTVLTLNYDPKSVCPPLCQMLTGLCYSPVCCSVSQHLRRVQRTSQSALGVSYNLLCVSVNFNFKANILYVRLIVLVSFLSPLNSDFIFE